MFLKPARRGLIVRDPITMAPLPESGAEKPEGPYWRRQILAGDVVEGSAPRTKRQTASVPETKE